MTNWHIKSIQIGRPKVVELNGQPTKTAIYRQPVQQPVVVHADGLEGDGVGDMVNHGGVDKAICCHPWQHYTFWNAYFGWSLSLGAFGENLTLAGLTEIDAYIGDVWEIGTARFQISQPRIPCWKQSAKLEQPRFEKLTLQTLRTGFYLRVLKEGLIKSGQNIKLLDRPCPQASVIKVNRAMSEKDNQALAEEFATLPELAEGWREMFAKRLEERD